MSYSEEDAVVRHQDNSIDMLLRNTVRNDVESVTLLETFQVSEKKMQKS